MTASVANTHGVIERGRDELERIPQPVELDSKLHHPRIIYRLRQRFLRVLDGRLNRDDSIVNSHARESTGRFR